MSFKGKRPVFDKIIVAAKNFLRFQTNETKTSVVGPMQFKRRISVPASTLVAALAALAAQPLALAQGSPLPGSPMPGDGSSYSTPQSYDHGQNLAPLPGGNRGGGLPLQTNATHAHPGGGAPAAGAAQSIYQSLPLNAEEARIRLEELSNRLAVSRPDEVKDSIYALSEWLQDVADAHWRMFKAFEKVDATKVHAAKEKEIGLKFSALKNRAKLLKADLFIKQNRYPEALGPLVEIVTSEPNSSTGQDAYKRLVDMGFSEQVSNVELAEKGVGKK
jgi:hypothetical protein